MSRRRVSYESALVVLVPEAEAVVGRLRQRYDPSAAVGMPAQYLQECSSPDRPRWLDCPTVDCASTRCTWNETSDRQLRVLVFGESRGKHRPKLASARDDPMRQVIQEEAMFESISMQEFSHHLFDRAPPAE